MKIDSLVEVLDLINQAQQRILEARLTIEENKTNTAKQFDSTNRAFEILNSARIYIKESMTL